jgi:hypothetical protein
VRGGECTIVSLEQNPVRCQSLEICVSESRVIVLFGQSVVIASSREGDLYRVLQPNNDIPIEDVAGDCGGRRDGIDRHPISLATHVPDQEQRNADKEQAKAQ